MSVWTAEQKRRFEKAIITYDVEMPDRWQKMAEIVGEGKTAEDVKQHYVKLFKEIENIELGHHDILIPDGIPDGWLKVAPPVSEGKTAENVKQYYEEDIKSVESENNDSSGAKNSTNANEE